MRSAVSEKGQVTIPKALREKLGIRPGTVLTFSTHQGELIARKISTIDTLQKWRGKGRLPFGSGADDYLKRIRDDHSD